METRKDKMSAVCNSVDSVTRQRPSLTAILMIIGMAFTGVATFFGVKLEVGEVSHIATATQDRVIQLAQIAKEDRANIRQDHGTKLDRLTTRSLNNTARIGRVETILEVQLDFIGKQLKAQSDAIDKINNKFENESNRGHSGAGGGMR